MYDYNLVPKRDFGYDPEVDLHKVDPEGVLDLREAFVNGMIPADVSVDDTRFNGVADPSVLMERPKDSFERMRQYEYVKSSLQAARANAEQVTQSGEAK